MPENKPKVETDEERARFRKHYGCFPVLPATDGVLSCGHPESLLVRSVESDYHYCELCEAHSRRRDAEGNEADLLKDLHQERHQAEVYQKECGRLNGLLSAATKALTAIAPYVAHNGDKWPGDIARQALKEMGER